MLDVEGNLTPVWSEFFTNQHDLDKVTSRDINIGAVSLAKGASNNPTLEALDSSGVFTYHFSESQDNYVFGAFELQHDYQEGTNLKPHLHWYPVDTGTGNVKWSLEYWIAGNSGNVTGTKTVLAAATGTAWDKIDTEFSDITGLTFTIGMQVHFKLMREGTDATDTYGDKAALGTAGIHYKVDLNGSRETTRK